MRNRIRSILKASRIMLFGIVLVIILSLLPGCNRNDAPMKIPLDINKLFLVEIWDEVRIVTGIGESPAYLYDMKLDAFKGKVTILRFNCIVFKEPDWIGYSIGFNTQENGELYYNFDEWDKNEFESAANFLTLAPGTLFAEIDKFGLTNIRPTVSGFTFDVETQHGSTFDADHLSLFQLKDGTLTPLKYVKLSSDQPGLSILVGSHARTVPRDNIDEIYEEPEWWFLSEDLAKAEVVEYQE